MKTKIAAMAGLVLAVAAAASCGGDRKAVAEKPPLVTGVRVEKVVLGQVEDLYEATGTVRSRTSTELSSRIMGTVTAVRAREGDRVRSGQVLIEVDNRDAAAQLQKAQAGLREAEEGLNEVEQSISAAQSARNAADANRRLASSTFNRYQALAERKSISPQEFDEARARLQVAEAEADRAEKMLQMLAARKSQMQARVDQAKAGISSAQVLAGYSRIVAPIGGIVVAKSVEAGSTAVPGAPLMTIEDDSHYRFEASVEESRLGRVRMGERVRVRIDAAGEGALEGSVGEIVPAADPASRSFTVKIDLPARQGLRSGLYGVAAFSLGQKQAIVVPRKAIVQRGQLTGIYVVDAENIARLRLVRTGKSFGESLEILSGINDGERIVTDGAGKVADGSRVQ